MPDEQSLSTQAQNAMESLRGLVEGLFDKFGSRPGDFLWDQITSFTWLQAILVITFGIVCLLYGWRVFKILTVVSLAILGAGLGMWVGRQMGNQTAGGIIGLFLLGILSIWLIKWGVRTLGGLAAGFAAAGIAYAMNVDNMALLASFFIGFIGGVVFSFMVFKGAIILFTSFIGGLLTTAGVLAVLYLFEQQAGTETKITRALIYTFRWFMPAAVLAATTFGFVIQTKFSKPPKKGKKGGGGGDDRE